MVKLRKIAAIVVTAAILAVVYVNLDASKFLAVFRQLNWIWFAVSILIFVPIFMLRAWRLNLLFESKLGLSNAIRCSLAGNSLSLVLPSKGGELAKMFFLRRHVTDELPVCASIVVYERVLDVAAIAVVFFAGLIFIPDQRPVFLISILCAGGLLVLVFLYFALHLAPGAKRWMERWPDWLKLPRKFIINSHETVREKVYGPHSTAIVLQSFALWMIHLGQFYCFFQAVSYAGPASTITAYVPAAIIVGLIPITIAGIGTRDTAIILLFAPWSVREPLAFVALLSHLRFILPGLCGIWFAHDYIRGEKRDSK